MSYCTITSFAIALQNLEKILGGEQKMNSKTVFFFKKCKQSIQLQHAMHHSETHIVAEILSYRDSGSLNAQSDWEKYEKARPDNLCGKQNVFYNVTSIFEVKKNLLRFQFSLKWRVVHLVWQAGIHSKC